MINSACADARARLPLALSRQGAFDALEGQVYAAGKNEVFTAAKPGGEPPMNCEITPIVCAFTTATALSAWSPPRRRGEIPK